MEGESMHRRTFITTVVLSNLLFILLHIHKYSVFNELHYRKQRYEKELTQLEKQRDNLQQELCALHDRKTVTRYAQKYLHMSPIAIGQLRKINGNLS
jgi:peptidoglycan hydrolase CwlO-like protein